MNHETAANIVRTRVQQQFQEPLEIETAYDNVSFNPTDSTQEYAVATVKFGESIRIEAGSAGSFRTVGILYLQILTRVGVGDARSLQLGDKARRAFRAVTVDEVRFRSPSIIPQGFMNGWWQVTVTCPFDFDDQA